MRQAQTIKHNMTVAEHNKRVLEERKQRKKTGSEGDASEAVDTEGAGKQARGRSAGARAEVDIEEKGENSFFIRAGGKRIFFNRDEMRDLAKICHAAETETEGAQGLYRRLERERKDFLVDTGISGPRDPDLAALYSLIRRRYRPRQS